MAYTQTDLDKLRKAEITLAAGEQASSTVIDGDTVTFRDPVALRQLIVIIERHLGQTHARTYASNGGRG